MNLNLNFQVFFLNLKFKCSQFCVYKLKITFNQINKELTAKIHCLKIRHPLQTLCIIKITKKIEKLIHALFAKS